MTNVWKQNLFSNFFLQKPVYNVLAITVHISRIWRYVFSTVLIIENFFNKCFTVNTFFFIITPSIHYHCIRSVWNVLNAVRRIKSRLHNLVNQDQFILYKQYTINFSMAHLGSFFYLQIINPFSFYQIIYNNSNLYMLRKKPMKFNSIFFTLILVAITIPCTNYKSYLLSFRILYYLSGCLIDKLKPETIFKLVYLFLDCCCRATLTRFSA